MAEDLAELLDALEIDRIPVVAYSAGGPHGLALSACHGGRVLALAVVGGAAPVNSEERRGLIGVNAGLSEVLGRGWEAMHGYLEPLAGRILEGGTAAVVADAPDSDLGRVAGRVERGRANRQEALRQGVAGWVDEALAITGPWAIRARPGCGMAEFHFPLPAVGPSLKTAVD